MIRNSKGNTSENVRRNLETLGLEFRNDGRNLCWKRDPRLGGDQDLDAERFDVKPIALFVVVAWISLPSLCPPCQATQAGRLSSVCIECAVLSCFRERCQEIQALPRRDTVNGRSAKG